MRQALFLICTKKSAQIYISHCKSAEMVVYYPQNVDF